MSTTVLLPYGTRIPLLSGALLLVLLTRSWQTTACRRRLQPRLACSL